MVVQGHWMRLKPTESPSKLGSSIILSLTFEIKIELPTSIRSLQGVVEVAR